MPWFAPKTYIKPMQLLWSMAQICCSKQEVYTQQFCKRWTAFTCYRTVIVPFISIYIKPPHLTFCALKIFESRGCTEVMCDNTFIFTLFNIIWVNTSSNTNRTEIMGEINFFKLFSCDLNNRRGPFTDLSRNRMYFQLDLKAYFTSCSFQSNLHVYVITKNASLKVDYIARYW